MPPGRRCSTPTARTGCARSTSWRTRWSCSPPAGAPDRAGWRPSTTLAASGRTWSTLPSRPASPSRRSPSRPGGGWRACWRRAWSPPTPWTPGAPATTPRGSSWRPWPRSPTTRDRRGGALRRPLHRTPAAHRLSQRGAASRRQHSQAHGAARQSQQARSTRATPPSSATAACRCWKGPPPAWRPSGTCSTTGTSAPAPAAAAQARPARRAGAMARACRTASRCPRPRAWRCSSTMASRWSPPPAPPPSRRPWPRPAASAGRSRSRPPSVASPTRPGPGACGSGSPTPASWPRPTGSCPVASARR
jgi:hypothetical protein